MQQEVSSTTMKTAKTNLLIKNGIEYAPTMAGIYKIAKVIHSTMWSWTRSEIENKIFNKLVSLKNDNFCDTDYIKKLCYVFIANMAFKNQDGDLYPYKKAMIKFNNKMLKTPDDFETIRSVISDFGYMTEILSDASFDNITSRYYCSSNNRYNNQTNLMFKNNLSRLGCCYFEKKLFKRIVRVCADCGELFISQNDISGGLAQSIAQRDESILGVDDYCGDCADNWGYKRCENCHLWFDEYDDFYYVENTEEYICSDCAQDSNFHECEHCGNLIDTNCDGDYVWTDDDCFYCCEDCAYDAGYHYSEDRDEWTQDDEVEELFDKYHQNRDFDPIGEQDNRMKHDLMTGVEVEVDGRDRHDDYDFWAQMKDYYYDRFNFTEDSSVEVELVSKPMFEKNFASFDWAEFLKRLSDYGYRSHDTTTCGQHFHFSSWYLGYNQRQKVNSAKKLIRFFQNNKVDLIKLSRRKSEQLHWCDIHTEELVDKNTKITGILRERYNAVNLSNLNCPDFGLYGNIDTIEIRLARGTLNPNTLLATWKIWLTLVRNAKNISWKNIDNLDLWFKGLNQRAIDYMKSRGCFTDYVTAHQVLDTGENYCEE